LIEEFFDGEVDERTGEQIAAHLATCADCAAALDALSFEQEIYARYDRGIEVSPALWAAVSAEIARGPQAETNAPRRNFLSRARASVAAALAALALRPAFASTLALLVVGVAVGSLWLARRPTPEVRSAVASNVNEGRTSASPASATPTAPVETGEGNKKQDGDGTAVAASDANRVNEIKRSIVRPPANHVDNARLPDEAERALEYTPPPNELTKDTVTIAANDHKAEDNPVSIVDVNLPPDNTKADAPLLDPSQKELARHVERAEMLLRSIKNARPTDGDRVNVSYEKNLSRKLLAENATLKLDADARGDRETKQVLDSIEPFLLDIANLRDDASREDVRSVRERVQKTEIIAALQVY
jgi:hypothetical protein